LKPERWGSPLVHQDKHLEKRFVTRDEIIIIIVITTKKKKQNIMLITALFDLR
jgi:hypothetical protein